MEEQAGEEENKKEETHAARNVLIALVILIAAFVLLFNLHRFYKQDTPNPYEYTYNGVQFRQDSDGKWNFAVQWANRLVNVPLQFGPKELASIPITGEVDERFSGEEIYITFEPAGSVTSPTGAVVQEPLGYLSLAAAELSLSLSQGMQFVPVAACTQNSTTCQDTPIITCTSTDQPTIYLNRTGTAAVHLDGNCITLSGEGLELLKSVDRLLLYWYRIMPKESG
ncbi:hypothetical protein HY491_00485 [Candidatus Woesearchaeota archaeon]|nr:hypothetical protein [Candidatus Woesearchaeota archaeon]